MQPLMDKTQEASTKQTRHFLLLFFYLPLAMCLFTGVFLPVYRVCCLHDAALLYERSHHRQRRHLHVAHRHAQRLSGRQSHGAGTASVAGESDDRRLLAHSSEPGWRN